MVIVWFAIVIIAAVIEAIFDGSHEHLVFRRRVPRPHHRRHLRRNARFDHRAGRHLRRRPPPRCWSCCARSSSITSRKTRF
ncbi:MAG: hypothetical protein MZU84_07275 [Sphingobacterium sp.]|nr:hypothetical protein [Sphingobacterium sp.]